MHHPDRHFSFAALGFLGQPARRAHPVQRLVGTVVGVHTHRAVGLEEQQPACRGQMSGEASDVVHGAAGDDEAHATHLKRERWRLANEAFAAMVGYSREDLTTMTAQSLVMCITPADSGV